MKRGIAVYCPVCYLMKKPIGRDASPLWTMCDRDCPGYREEPFVGSLWPGETEAEFGYPVGKDGTEEVEES